MALTKGEKEDYIRLKICPSGKIATIHSGVDTDRYLKARVKIRNKKLSLGLRPEAKTVNYKLACRSSF
ncbi:MAG: hypothetical protein GY749_32965 [Desulfobacteraceae bacterium]|nr:hypothetical protein [Desulfobacteraceae bacterium]